MVKRKTKAQREQEAKDALLQRITDIYSGACGRDMSADDDAYPTIEEMSRVIPAVRDVFGEPLPDWWGWKAHCLNRWETPKGAAEWLFEHEFRADERWEEATDGE